MKLNECCVSTRLYGCIKNALTRKNPTGNWLHGAWCYEQFRKYAGIKNQMYIDEFENNEIEIETLLRIPEYIWLKQPSLGRKTYNTEIKVWREKLGVTEMEELK